MDGRVATQRVAKLKAAMEDSDLRGMIIVPGPNLRYFTGVESLLLERPFILLVPSAGEAQLVAPRLESGPYTECPLPMKLHAWTDSEGSAGAIRAAAKAAGVSGRWGVEGKVPYLFLDRLLKSASPELREGEAVLQGLREIKDESEVRLLKKSGKILSKSFEEFPDLIKEGATEMEIAKSATEVIYGNGATKVDDLLVQSGPRGADPHGLPSARKIRRGEGVIIDIGSTYEGYYADITRTYVLGANSEVERVYSKVLEAEERAIEAARDGVPVGKVDAAARQVLVKAGMGKYFIHRTGHGLGLEVHEAPYIVEGGKEKLEDWMCFTAEPGVYMRGRLGVRIEDNILMEGGRGSVLTGAPKEFGWWR